MAAKAPQRAVITGAASGLGCALSEELARRGTALLLLDVNEDGLAAQAAVLARHGVPIETRVCDVANLEEVEAAAAFGRERLGPVDFVANNAGVAVGGPFDQIDMEDWTWIFGVNLWGVVHGCRAFLPQLRERGGGAILNVASAAGLLNAPRMAPYNVTKAGVISLSETLATELAREDIRVSALCPTFFETSILESSRGVKGKEQRLAAALMRRSKIQAADVARQAIDETLAGVGTIVPMPDGRWLWRLKRATPRMFPRLARAAYERGRRRLEQP